MCIEKFSCKKIPVFERTLEEFFQIISRFFSIHMHFIAEAVMSRLELKKMPQIIKCRNSILFEFNSPHLVLLSRFWYCIWTSFPSSRHMQETADLQQNLVFFISIPYLMCSLYGIKRIDRFHNVRFHYDFFDILF